jgi:putative hemolysin
MMRRVSARPVLAALVAGMSLAACSNSDHPSTSATTTTTTFVSHDTVVPLSVPNQDSVRKDVDLLTCAKSADGWSAGGALRNTLGEAATYTITVFFTSSQSTDLAYATTMAEVDNGKFALWSAKATFAAPASVLCVLRGVSAS